VWQKLFMPQIDTLPIFAPMSTVIQFEQIADGLAEKSHAVIDNFLSPGEVEAILNTDEFTHAKLHFKKAGIGKSQDRHVNESIRGDFIQWIDPAHTNSAIGVYTNRLRELLQYLKQALYLSLKNAEVHMTVYPIGTFYKRHLDQFRADDYRKLSVICYLNNDWSEKDGGQLKMYLPEGPVEVLPISGRLVCFRSDKIEHEVLPATKDRLSITGWITDRVL
jgi:SM-20-related protein